MSSRFQERLDTGPIVVADGGMGVLISSAVPRLRCPEEANIRSPESVVTLHTSFIRAGADLIETNTFGANRRKLAQQYLEDEFERINSAGVKLAREAREVAGRDVFIAGSIGPLGDAELQAAEPGALYAEQARVLEGRGADLFMVETFFDLGDLETAVVAVRAVSSLPIVALMSFDAAGETIGGVSAESAGARLRELDVAAFGANHGAGPTAALRALAAMQADGAPLAVLPNVGLASMSGHRVVFPHATPEYFGEFAAQARALGAQIIGGCCGTTPAHIAALARILEGRAPRRPAASRAAAISGIEVFYPADDNRPLLVGERTNVIGSRKFKELIVADKFEEAAEVGRAQVKGGAQVVDVCLANPDRDENAERAR
jgi:5-methyltetrahydrofolate--homocysteine methyltransferase